jgi:hypothetical protein
MPEKLRLDILIGHTESPRRRESANARNDVTKASPNVWRRKG